MPAAPLPDREAERLAALRACDLLDTPSEQAFDDLALVAARLFDVPIALVSLVDEDRQWFKARIGLDACQTSRDQAFCAWAVRDTERVLVVEDTLLDPRFADNALVTGQPGIRFYAGAPLVNREGHALGTLCVIDTRARSASSADIAALTALARQVTARIEQRSALRELAGTTQRLLSVESELRARVEHLGLIEQLGRIVITETSEAETVARALELCRERLGASEAVLVLSEPPHGVGGNLREVAHCGAERLLTQERESWAAWLACGPLGPLRGDDDGKRTWLCMGFERDGVERGAVLLRCATGRRLERMEIELLRMLSVRLGIFQERADIALERARVAARLAESEQRFRSLTDDSPVMMWLGAADGGCVHVNRSWIEFTGRPFEDQLGAGWLAGVHPDDLERLQTTFRRAFEARAPFACEFRIPRADGELRWVLTAGRARIDESGEFLGYMGSCLDITERVQDERAARTSRDRALESSRTQARFLSALGKELRAPLQGLVGALDLTLDCESSEEQRELLTLAHKATVALRERLDVVFELSQIEAASATVVREPYDPRALAESWIEEQRSRALAVGHDLTLLFDPRAEENRMGDGAGLRRVLSVLFGHVLSGRTAARLVLRVAPGSDGKIVWSLVDAARARTELQGGATQALNLALAGRLLRRMGSELVEGGAAGALYSFTLTDELADEPQAALPVQPAFEASYTDGLGLHALVVGGDVLTRDVLARMLRARRFEVEVLQDGLAAVARLRAGAGFDVVLIDADSSGEEGPEIVRRLRALERDRGELRAPILGLIAESTDLPGWLAAGADTCLHKPVGRADLESALGEWVGGLRAIHAAQTCESASRLLHGQGN